MNAPHSSRLWELLIGTAIITLVLLLMELLITAFDWIDRLD
jgi:hypothetical protein